MPCAWSLSTMHLPILLCVLGVSRAVFVPKLPSNHSPGRASEAELRAYQLSDHEEPATGRPYRLPGDWATPAPDSGIDLGFTPVQTYVAVRRTNTVKRLPRSEAFKEASSPDELRNSHRLREVLRTKKIQEVYSEEGYEDSAYDHGTRERVAEYEEDYDKVHKDKKRGLKKYAHKEDSDDAESRPAEVKSRKGPKTSRKKVETKNVEFSYVEPEDNPKSRKSRRGESSKNGNVKKEGGLSSRNYREYSANGDFVDFPHITFEDWKPRSKKPQDVFSKGHFGKSNQQADDPSTYIHSLTDAHYGHQPPVPRRQPKAIPSNLIGMTKGFAAAPDFTGFESRKVRNRVKRDVASSSTQYEKELAKALDEHEKFIVGKVLDNIKTPVMDSDQWHPLLKLSTPPKPKASWIDAFKYPYYHLQNIDPYSPLKYASNPQQFPKKSGRAMEFYDSRDRLVQCDDINVSVESSNDTQPAKNVKRIVGLGDKIQCMKNKYFGEDPLDSPFFKEDSTGQQASSTDTNASGSKVVEEKIASQVNDSAAEGNQPEVNYEVFHPVPLRSAENKTQGRVIPVKELYPEITTPVAIQGMQAPVAFQFHPFSLISIPKIPKPKPLKQIKKVKSQYNCLQPVTRMIVTERSDEDVMYDCPDVTLIQTVRDGHQHFKIIPKKLIIRGRSGEGPVVRVVRAGEVIEARHSRHRRSDDPNAKRRSQLFPNRGLLDKMIQRSPVSRRSNATSGTSTTTTSPRPATSVKTPSVPRTDRNRAPISTPRPPRTTSPSVQKSTTPVSSPSTKIMPKKQSGKLSGLDFLTRYHKAKNANRDGTKGVEFFKAEPTSDMEKAGTQNIRKRWITAADMSDPVLTGSSYLRRSDVLENRMRRSWSEPANKTPVLLYVVNVDTGIGKWISEPTIIPEVKWMSQRYLPILQPKN